MNLKKIERAVENATELMLLPILKTVGESVWKPTSVILKKARPVKRVMILNELLKYDFPTTKPPTKSKD